MGRATMMVADRRTRAVRTMGVRFRSLSRKAKVRRMAAPASPASNTSGGQAAHATAGSGQDDSDPLKRSAQAAMAAAPQPSIEPAAAGPGLRVAVLHNSKLGAPAQNGKAPKDVLAELVNPRNVQDYVTALRALGHIVMAFDGGTGLTALLAGHQIDICFN